MRTTTDLKEFGFRELKVAAELLTSYCESPPDFLSDGVHLMMNTYSGYVFLTDEGFNVAMMNGGTLEQFHSCPECGAEGFAEELQRVLPALSAGGALMNNATRNEDQLGFDSLLGAAEAENRAHRFERETGHLPGTMDEALPFYRVLLKQHHAATLAADVDEAMRLRKEAHKLALRVNGGEPGILAGPDAPGCVLEDRSAAAPGTVPIWGQTGSFVIDVDRMKVRIELDGIFGICASACYWPGFAAHVVEGERPFLSQT